MIAILLSKLGVRQMHFLKDLIGSRRFFERIEDQQLIVNSQGDGGNHMQATRDDSYALVWFPTNDHTASIDLARIKAISIRT